MAGSLNMSRVLAGFAGGITTGLGLLGLYHWRYGRKAPIGRIFKVGGRYYADSAVVDDLLRRVPGSQQYGDGGQLYLFRRGRVTFEQPHGYGGQLPGQVGPRLFVIHAYDTDVEGLVIEWIRFGLARPGAFFSTWPTEQTRGTWTPAPEPLHPFAFDPKRQASNAVAPLPEERPRPIGHYFQVGANFYADENILQILEGFVGADFGKGRTNVPLWRRGHLELFSQTPAKMLPEQVGALHSIEPHLTAISLPDLLVELEHLGLVSWGGTWPKFPERLTGTAPTGPLTTMPAGRVFELGGRLYLDELARRRVLSRLPVEAGAVQWQGHGFALIQVPPSPELDVNGLYVVTPAAGNAADGAARAFAEELILHRVARREERPTAASSTAATAPVSDRAIEAAAERLVAALPRPDLAPLRQRTRRHLVPVGSLVALPLDPAEAKVYEPEDRSGAPERSSGVRADPTVDVGAALRVDLMGVTAVVGDVDALDAANDPAPRVRVVLIERSSALAGLHVQVVLGHIRWSVHDAARHSVQGVSALAELAAVPRRLFHRRGGAGESRTRIPIKIVRSGQKVRRVEVVVDVEEASVLIAASGDGGVGHQEGIIVTNHALVRGRSREVHPPRREEDLRGRDRMDRAVLLAVAP
jgi:hypothetical protein